MVDHSNISIFSVLLFRRAVIGAVLVHLLVSAQVGHDGEMTVAAFNVASVCYAFH